MTSDVSNPPPLRFTQITLSQMDRVESIRAESGSTLYIYSFASLFAWQETERYSIYISEDVFLVKHGVRGEDAYLFPCGTERGRKRLIDELLLRGKPVFSYVSDEDKLFLESAYPGKFIFTACRDDYPYLYDKDEQIAMAGKDFKNLRHQVHLGLAAASTWTVELLTADNVERALRINRKWADEHSDGVLADTAAAETALRHFSPLRLWGLLFQADSKDVAYAAGSFVAPEIFDVSFCKVLNKQCDCYIKWALYRALPAEVKIVDSEEDMGIAGLRTHKLLRRPKELVRVWKGSAQ